MSDTPFTDQDLLKSLVLAILERKTVVPPTAAAIAKYLGSTRSAISWQLQRLEREQRVHVTGEAFYRKGKRAPTYAAGLPDPKRAAEFDLLPTRQVVVSCRERPCPNISPAPILRALFPHWNP